jgi:hypothetical protein
MILRVGAKNALKDTYALSNPSTPTTIAAIAIRAGSAEARERQKLVGSYATRVESYEAGCKPAERYCAFTVPDNRRPHGFPS